MSELVESVQTGSSEDWAVLYSSQNITGVPEMLKQFEFLAQEEQRMVRDLEHLLPRLILAACGEIERAAPGYLQLPVALSSIEQDRFYYPFARSYGRLWFRMDQYTVNADSDLVRVPHALSRRAIHDFIDSTIRLSDKQLSVGVPLVFRVGLVVGWLSALAVSQREDAQAGIVLLTAFVSPLLVPQRASSGGSPVQVKQLKRKSVKRK